MKNTKIVGSNEPKNKKILYILLGLLSVSIIIATIFFLSSTKDMQTDNNDILVTPVPVTSTPIPTNLPTKTPDESKIEIIEPTPTPEGYWDSSEIEEEIINLPENEEKTEDISPSDIPNDNPTTNNNPVTNDNPNTKTESRKSIIPDNIQEYIDFSNIMNEMNWPIIFEAFGLDIGDIQGLKIKNEEMLNKIYNRDKIEISEQKLAKIALDTLKSVQQNIKNQITQYPDSFETDMIKRVIEFNKPDYDYLHSVLFNNDYVYNKSGVEWTGILQYWAFNNEYKFEGEKQKSYDQIYMHIIGENLYLENYSEAIVFGVYEIIPENNLTYDDQEAKVVALFAMNGRIFTATYGIRNNDYIILDIS